MGLRILSHRGSNSIPHLIHGDGAPLCAKEGTAQTSLPDRYPDVLVLHGNNACAGVRPSFPVLKTIMRELYIRNIIFGITDSLVSTVGLLAGIDVAGSSHSTIILTGIVYAFVESLSMAMGSFLSEEATEEFATKSEDTSTAPVVAGVVMFLSFLLASFIPLLPYVLVQSSFALLVSIGLSLLTLFIVGLVMAKLSKIHLFRHAVKMVLLGGAAILVGVIVGKYIHIQ
jgi:VIT1/CCC1 family predicted Fe2+/Mn2+ transporter